MAIFEKIERPWKKILAGRWAPGCDYFLLSPTLRGRLRGGEPGAEGRVSSPLWTDTFFEGWKDTFALAAFYILLVIGIKVIATTLTFAAGGIGGIFAPSLFMGANTDLLFGLAPEPAGY